MNWKKRNRYSFLSIFLCNNFQKGPFKSIQTFSTFLPKIVPRRYQDMRKMQVYCRPSLPEIVRLKLVSFEVVNNKFFSTYLNCQSETLSKCLRRLPHYFCRRLLLCFALYTFKNAIKWIVIIVVVISLFSILALRNWSFYR